MSSGLDLPNWNASLTTFYDSDTMTLVRLEGTTLVDRGSFLGTGL